MMYTVTHKLYACGHCGRTQSQRARCPHSDNAYSWWTRGQIALIRAGRPPVVADPWTHHRPALVAESDSGYCR